MNPKKVLIVVVAIVAVLTIYALKRDDVSHPEVAWTGGKDLAPDFLLPDLTGQQLRLSSYRGKVVLLDFWATWCAPCREETPHLVELQNKYGERGLQIIGVSMDDGPEPAREFFTQFKINYPVVMGNARIGELYGGILGLPVAYVIDREGRIYRRHIGATDVSVIEKEVVNLLQKEIQSGSNRS